MKVEELKALLAEKKKKPGRYGENKRIVTTDGEKFDSKAELRRWRELEVLALAGKVSDLRRQVVFILAPSVKFAGSPKAQPAMRFTADYVYTDMETGQQVVEDMKPRGGPKDTAFQMRRHLMLSVHGIDIKFSFG